MSTYQIEYTPEVIRAWARDQGEIVPDRGRIGKDMRARYFEAMGVDDPELAEDQADLGATYEAGVSAADFPADHVDPGDFDEPAAAARAEVRPRKVAAPKRPRPGIVGRLAGSTGGSRGRKRKPKRPRVPVTELIEESWYQLAWAAQPIPPLSKILTIQAPFAGLILEEQVRETAVDKLLQPLARYHSLSKILSGLFGPPVAIALIMATGKEHPVYPFAHAMLRYSLLSMGKISEVKIEEALIKAAENAEAGRDIDQLIEWLFEMPAAGQSPAEAEAEAAARTSQAFRS